MKRFFRTFTVFAAAALLSLSFSLTALAVETETQAQEAAEQAVEMNETSFEEVGPGVSLEEYVEEAEVGEQSLREGVVEYALSFVGGRYVWGGTDPHTGVDCSGFTRYIFGNKADVSLTHSSKEQSRVGKTVSEAEMQPGDLMFYSHGKGGVDHVAIYIGDGQIVHASTERTGIKVSKWDYRKPVRIASVLG